MSPSLFLFPAAGGNVSSASACLPDKKEGLQWIKTHSKNMMEAQEHPKGKPSSLEEGSSPAVSLSKSGGSFYTEEKMW